MTLDPGAGLPGPADGAPAQKPARRVPRATRPRGVARVFAQCLVRHMQCRGLRAADIARQIGHNHGSVSRWTRAHYLPSAQQAAQLADALGLTGIDRVEYFARWELARTSDRTLAMVAALATGRLTGRDLPPGLVADLARLAEPEPPPTEPEPAPPPDDDGDDACPAPSTSGLS